jgi:hypothetical protein
LTFGIFLYFYILVAFFLNINYINIFLYVIITIKILTAMQPICSLLFFLKKNK